jgi:hypothetical protein
MSYSICDDHIQGARMVLAPQYRSLSDQELRNYLNYLASGMSEEDAEGFLSGLGNTFKSVAKTVGQVALQAAPIVAPLAGAAAGTLIGGPVGAQIGSTVGNTVGQFVSGVGRGQSVGTALKGAAGTGLQGLAGMAGGALGGSGGALGGIGNLLGSLSGGGAGSPGGAGVSGVASSIGRVRPRALDLTTFLQNPNVSRSISSAMMGAAGQRSQPVAGIPLNPSQILAALSMLSHRAAEEAAEDAEDTGNVYLLNPDGTYAVDPANPEQRAMRVLQWIRQDSRNSRPRGVEAAPSSQKTLTEWLREAGLINN